MKNHTEKLHVLIPGLSGPMPNLAGSSAEPALSELLRLLSRADVEAFSGADYLGSLFSLFGLPVSPGVDPPAGALGLLGCGGEPGEHCYLRADPVHLRADRDRLLLFDSQCLGIEEAEAAAIAEEFNRHFAADGMRLLTPRAQRWYLRVDACPELQTRPLSAVAGRHLESFQPSGADAGHWRRLGNEMQMLLFQTAVNQRRETEGRLAINGIWLSGVGRLPASVPQAFQRVYADEPTALGLARLAGIAAKPVAAAAGPLCQVDEEVLLVLDELVPALQRADPFAWCESLRRVQARLLEQMQGIGGGRLLIYPGNGQRFVLTKAATRRFWRRARALTAFLQDGSAIQR